MKIVIDKREKGMLEIIKGNDDIEYEEKMLDIGDIQIMNDEDEIEYLIERKTINDLMSSIIDGRYKEQKTRILENIDKSKFIYLIEMTGYVKKYEKMINGFLLNNIFRDNITIIYSFNIQHSINLIITFYNKLKYKEFLIDNKMVNFIHNQTKKKKILENKFENVLMCIPNVSQETAKVIKLKYDKLINLIDDFKKNGEDILSDIIINKRKIGNKMSKNIYNFLMN